MFSYKVRSAEERSHYETWLSNIISKPDNKFNTLGGRGLGQKKDDLVLSRIKCWRDFGTVKVP